jgi:hypothetical protein
MHLSRPSSTRVALALLKFRLYQIDVEILFRDKQLDV